MICTIQLLIIDAVDVNGSDNLKWLDDNELSKLSALEIEALMDSYIMLVVKQLVQLAAIDDELIAEIDSLDASGYSLLHYCCKNIILHTLVTLYIVI